MEKEKVRKKRKWPWLLLLLLLLLLLFYFQYKLDSYGRQMEAEQKRLDSLTMLQREKQRETDSLAALDSVSDATDRLDSIRLDSLFRDSLLRLKRAKDKKYSLEEPSSSSNFQPAFLSGDSIPPRVIFDPPGGRFFESVELGFRCPEKKCKLLVSLGDSSKLTPFVEKIVLTKSAEIFARAVDSVGNRSQIFSQHYTIEKKTADCAEGMVHIGLSKKSFCVDEFEWPNRQGAVPTAFVSHKNAVDSCSTAGKRLCSLDEWQFACGGPELLRYPYGENYDERACVGVSSKAGRSGRKSVCRSYYGNYDMAGNLWEWTSTPSGKVRGRFEVAGGAWDAGVRASCTHTRFSFYPQNEYPFVGFRCCSNAKQ